MTFSIPFTIVWSGIVCQEVDIVVRDPATATEKLQTKKAALKASKVDPHPPGIYHVPKIKNFGSQYYENLIPKFQNFGHYARNVVVDTGSSVWSARSRTDR